MSPMTPLCFSPLHVGAHSSTVFDRHPGWSAHCGCFSPLHVGAHSSTVLDEMREERDNLDAFQSPSRRGALFYVA